MKKRVISFIIVVAILATTINFNTFFLGDIANASSDNQYIFSDGTGYAILPEGITKDIKVKGYPINEKYLKEGLLIFGHDTESFYKSINPRSVDYKNGEWRYLGYNISGVLFGNDNFPRDSDTGRDPWEKDMIPDPWKLNLIGEPKLNEKPEARASIQSILDTQGFPSSWTVDKAMKYFYILNLKGPGMTPQIVFYHRNAGKVWYQTLAGEADPIPVIENTSVTADFELKDEVYEYQSVGYKDTSIAENSSINYRKLTILGDNGHERVIENQTKPDIKLTEGTYTFVLQVENDDPVNVKSDMAIKEINVIKQAVEVPSKAIAIINAPDEAPIGQAFTVDGQGSFASTGAKIVEWKWYLGTDASNLVYDSSYDNKPSINVSYDKEEERCFRLWIKDSADKEAWSNVAITKIVDNTPTSVIAKVNAPDIVYEGVPFNVDTRGSKVIYGEERLSPKEAVKKGIASYSYNLSCAKYGRLGAGGGEIYIEELGDQTIKYRLRAKGASDNDFDIFTVKPTPVVKFNLTGIHKVNRKLILDTTLTKTHINYPIDEDNTTIVIKDLFSNKSYYINGEGNSLNTAYIKTLSYENGKLPLTIKKAGDYQITVTKEDTRGKSSTETHTYTIKEDIAPVADFLSPTITYRDTDGKATIKVRKNHISIDNDIIGTQILKYRYDVDEDGNLSDESYITVTSYKDEIEIMLDRVGKIEVDFFIKEDFEHIPQHVSDGDFLSNRKTKIIKIDNIAPVTSFNLIKRTSMDMLFMTENKYLQDTISKTDLLKNEFNNRTDLIVDVNKEVIDVDMSSEPVTMLGSSPWYSKGRLDPSVPNHTNNNGYLLRKNDYVYTTFPPEEKGYFGVGWTDYSLKYKLEDRFGTYCISNIKSYNFKENGQWNTRSFIINDNVIKEIDVGNGTVIHSIEIDPNLSLSGYELIIESNKKDILRLVSSAKTHYVEVDYSTGNTIKNETLPGTYFGENNGYVYSYKTSGFKFEIYKTKKGVNRLVKSVSKTYQDVLSLEHYESKQWEKRNYSFYILSTFVNPVIHNGKIIVPYSNRYAIRYRIYKSGGRVYTSYENNGVRNNLLIMDLNTENTIKHTELSNNFKDGSEQRVGYIDTKIIENDFILIKFLHGISNINPLYILNKNGDVYFREDSNYANKYEQFSYGLINGKLQGSIWYEDTDYMRDSEYSNGYKRRLIKGIHFKEDYKVSFHYAKENRYDEDEEEPSLISPIDMQKRYIGIANYKNDIVYLYDLVNYQRNDIPLMINFSTGKIIKEHSYGFAMPIGDNKVFIIIDKGTCVYDYSKNQTIYDIGYVYNSESCGHGYLISPNGKYLSYFVANYGWDATKIVHYKLSIGFYEDVIKKLNNYTFKENSKNNFLVITTKNLIDISDSQINEISNLANTKGARIIFLGSSNNQIIGKRLATETNGIFYTYTTLDDAMTKLKGYVNQILTAQGNEKTMYVKKGEEIIYDKYYIDYEGDSEYKPSGERWKYVQDLSYPHDGIVSYNNQWLTLPKASIDKVGRYFVTFLKRDNPPPSNNNYDTYRKWARENPVTIIVYDGETPSEEIMKPKINIDIQGDLRENHRVDFYINIIPGTKPINMSTLDISFDKIDYLPYTKPNTLKFSRVFKNIGTHNITVKIKDTEGNLTAVTVPFTINRDELPHTGFTLVGDGKRNELGEAKFELEESYSKTDDEIGIVEYFIEGIKYIDNGDGTYSPSGTMYYPLELNEYGQIELNKIGLNRIKQIVTEHYVNGTGLNGEDLDQYRVFNFVDKTIPIEVINEAPQLEYKVLPEIIIVGDKVKHNQNVIDDTPHGDYAKYKFTHNDVYYQNSHGKHENSDKITDEPQEVLDRKGLYSFYAIAYDENYSNSDWTYGGKVLVVSQPMADFELTSNAKLQNDVFKTGSIITIENKAYNEDYEATVPNHGIEYLKLEYKNITDSDYTTIFEGDKMTSYIPTFNTPKINQRGIYEVKMTVRSPEGIEGTCTKRFTVLNLTLDVELEPDTIYASQSYKIKAKLSKDGLGAVAYIPYANEWITLDKVNEDTNNMYYEKTITTLENLKDDIYDIEIYGMYPFNNELKKVLPLTVDTPIELQSDIKPIGPSEYTKIIQDNDIDNDYIQVPAGEKVQITAQVTSPVALEFVKAELEGEAPISLIYNNASGQYEGTVNIPNTKHDKDYYDFVISTRIPNGNTSTNNHRIKIYTPIDLIPDMPNELISDTTVVIRAETSKYVESLTVTLFEGESFEKKLNMAVDKITGSKKEWIVEYDVPADFSEGVYTAEFRAETYNKNVQVDRESFKLQSLNLVDLRITHIYNHPKYEDKYPILYNDPMVPVEYKTGYYITFKINAKGSPDAVKMKITFLGYDEEFDMEKEFDDGSDSVWKLEWYSDPFTPKGTMINTEVKAVKDESELNFNSKYGWNGDYLKITGTIEQDWRVDQDF